MASAKHDARLRQHGTPPAATPTAPTSVQTATRVRRRLGMMLLMVVLAVGVAAAALGILVAGSEPVVAIVAAAVLLGVALLVGLTIVAERRRLRVEANRPPALAVVQSPKPATTNGATSINGSETGTNGSEWITAPPADGDVDERTRGQADLLEELLHWHPKGA